MNEKENELKVENETKDNEYNKKLRCPVHNDLIGKYDSRFGLTNAVFYCRKCKIEYYFTIKPQKPLDK